MLDSITVRIVGLFIVMLAMSACATFGVRPGGMHVVRAGERLSTIAQRYQASPQQLAEWNNIESGDAALKEGMRLYIPSGRRMKWSAKTWAKQGSTIKTYHGTFAWPVDGPVNSPFGMRNGNKHDGLDIGGKQGDPIHAAANGTVAFEGKMSGYGNLLIVRHENGLYTAYAHNSAHLVKKGDRVKQGQAIAKVGATGHATGPHLHFEVRDGQSARNPLFFLPPRNPNERAVYAQGSGPRKGAVVVAETKSAVGGAPVEIPAQAMLVERKPFRVARPTADRWKKFVPRGRQDPAPINSPYRAKALKGKHGR